MSERASLWEFLCRIIGHRPVTHFHSAGHTTYCKRCKASETVRRYT